MPPQELMVARSPKEINELWHSAVTEGERCADVALGPLLRGHLVMTLVSSMRDTALCRDVARQFLQKDSESLIMVAGRCLLIAGLFPALARRRNVGIGYFFKVGVGAYSAHSSYWSARGRHGLATCSKIASERFPDLFKTLRGMKGSPVTKEEVEALEIPEFRWN